MPSPVPSPEPTAPRRTLAVRRLGVVPYGEALALQQTLVAQRKAGEIPDTLLLLQHPHVITLGVKTDAARSHIVADPARLRSLGVEVVETGRGGDVTYHGPGQVVGYPIIDLDPDRRDVHRYVRDLEDVMIRVAAYYGVAAGRVPGLTGAWVRADAAERAALPSSGPAEKIGAIGVRISRWVTSHGFAFNVNTGLEFFHLIVPCGIADFGVTSLDRELGRHISLDEVEARFVHSFSDVFDRQVVSVESSRQ